MRHNGRDTRGRSAAAGSGRPSSVRLPNQGDHREQIVGAKEGPAGGHGDEGIGWDGVRPGSRDRAEPPGRVVKVDPILAPVMARRQEDEPLPMQRMERMGYLNPPRIGGIWRS